MKIRHKLDFFFPPEENEIARKKQSRETKGEFVSRHTLYIYLGLFNLAAVNNAQDVVNLLQLGETLLEALEVLLLGLTPLHLT